MLAFKPLPLFLYYLYTILYYTIVLVAKFCVKNVPVHFCENSFCYKKSRTGTDFSMTSFAVGYFLLYSRTIKVYCTHGSMKEKVVL
jgi:hypothetical protein